MAYVDGYVMSVPNDAREKYAAFAAKGWQKFKELGATSVTECWGDDVPHGKITDFHRAVQAKEGETIVFSWLVWPDKATRDEGMKVLMDPAAMSDMGEMPFDGKRVIYGGFSVLFTAEGGK